MMILRMIACSLPTDEEIENKSEEIAGHFMAALFSSTFSAGYERIVYRFIEKWPEAKALDPDHNASNHSKISELEDAGCE
jgi:hypothetical protein